MEFYSQSGGPSDATYNIKVSATDITNKDGSAYISQTIETKCDDGTTYTDTITYISDGKGDITETQTVTVTEPDGTTTAESGSAEGFWGGRRTRLVLWVSSSNV
jgi:hypothetical protein